MHGIDFILYNVNITEGATTDLTKQFEKLLISFYSYCEDCPVSMFQRLLFVRQLLPYLCFKMFVKAVDYQFDILSKYRREYCII